jgi:acetyl-CoA carboxylase carboxyl transferase subunit alpha
MKITAQDLLKMKVVDRIIPEPPGGAHSDPTA